MADKHEVHRLLDRHLLRLTERGATVASQLLPAPDESQIRDQLKQAGLHARDDVVAYFTWAGFPDVDSGYLQLFWETGGPASLWSAIEEHGQSIELFQEFRDEIGLDSKLSPAEEEAEFPGPHHWIPIAYLDGVEFMAVDSRPDPVGGEVWFLFNSSTNSRIFASLAEAIETAIYCVESGLWQVDEQGIECSRTTMAGEEDRESPPWVGYHDPPSIQP